MIIREEKIAIIVIHTKPNKIKKKKEVFYNKLRNIIKNNILVKTKIIIKRNVNSVWNKKSISKKDKENLDISIRNFYKEMRLIKEYREKQIIKSIENTFYT
jgi:hypothetical protein